jgi:hypothetical protein
MIGIQFHTLARPASFGNPRRPSSYLPPLMTCVYLHLSALMRWEIYLMTLKVCSIDIIQSLSWDIVSGFPAFIVESLIIFFGCW